MDQLIADGVDVNAKGKDNVTPLFWAFFDNKLPRFKKLLEHGADPNVLLTSNLGHPRIFAPNDSVVVLAASRGSKATLKLSWNTEAIQN